MQLNVRGFYLSEIKLKYKYIITLCLRKILSKKRQRSPGWYRVDTSDKDAKIFEGELTPESDWNGFKVWKKGRDVWDLGLEDINSETEMYKTSI